MKVVSVLRAAMMLPVVLSCGCGRGKGNLSVEDQIEAHIALGSLPLASGIWGIGDGVVTMRQVNESFSVYTFSGATAKSDLFLEREVRAAMVKEVSDAAASGRSWDGMVAASACYPSPRFVSRMKAMGVDWTTAKVAFVINEAKRTVARQEGSSIAVKNTNPVKITFGDEWDSPFHVFGLPNALPVHFRQGSITVAADGIVIGAGTEARVGSETRVYRDGHWK